MLDRRDRHRVAVEPGPGRRRPGVLVEAAEGLVDDSPFLALGGAVGGEPRQRLGRGQIERALPAEAAGEAGIDPLQPGHPLEDRQYVVGEGGPHRRRQRIVLDGEAAHQIPHRAHRLALRRVIGRRHHHPGGDHFERQPVQHHLGVDRPVGDVVVPAFVVGEGDGVAAVARGRFAMAAEHDQPAVLVGEDLAEIDLRAHELAVVELLAAWPRRRTLAASSGVMARLARSATAALRRVVGGACAASGMSSASWKPYQAALVLASCTFQVDLRVAIGAAQLADDRALGVDAVDAEARRFALQLVPVVAIGARVLGLGIGDLRADIIAVRAVADPRDADRRVDHRLDDAGRRAPARAARSGAARADPRSAGRWRGGAARRRRHRRPCAPRRSRIPAPARLPPAPARC